MSQNRKLLANLQPVIKPRSEWAGSQTPSKPILAEDDVRFLLIHHTASRNDYTQAEVADEIRGFHSFHTGPEKAWPDVAYNFFIDRFGGIWEARQGSLAGPVRGDATGGSQGFALLCSLIGDYRETAVTPVQQESLTQLLAWLAERHNIDTAPNATTTFTSRGSNRWPKGASVQASTISGHRDMSQTSCPGDGVYKLLSDTLPTAVSNLRAEANPSDATTTTEDTTPADSQPVEDSTPPTEPTTEPTETPNSTSPTTLGGSDASAALPEEGGGGNSILLPLSGGSAAFSAFVGVLAWRSRRIRRLNEAFQEEMDDHQDEEAE